MNKTLLLKLYLEKPATDIAKDHNLKPVQIQKLLRLYNIPKPYRNKDGKALDVNHILDLYHNQKKSIKEISSMLNSTLDMITNLLYDRTPTPKPTCDQLKACLNLSKRQIALKFNLKEYDVHRLLLEYKLNYNPFDLSKEELQEEYQSQTISQIAKKYHVDAIYVSVKLKEYGILNEINIDELKRLYCDERKTIKEIVFLLNSSETTLWRLIKKHKLQRPFNPNPHEFFKLWHDKTKTVDENIRYMAEYYKVSIGTIRLTARKLNISKKTTPIKIKYTQEQLQELYDKHDLFGLSVILKMNVANVRRALVRHGITIKKPPVKPMDLDRITQLYKTKYLDLKNLYAIQEIAKELDVAPTTLHRFIRSHKITR